MNKLKTPDGHTLEILYLYFEKSTSEIGKMYGVTKEAVRYRLVKCKIPVRGAKDPVVISQKIHTGEQNHRWKGRRITTDGYVEIRQPNHISANANGYVKRSHLVWEDHHGKKVPEGWIVHHKNGKRKDDRPENLEALTRAAHVRLHKPRLDVTVD